MPNYPWVWLDEAAYMLDKAGISRGESVLDAILRRGTVDLQAKEHPDDPIWEPITPPQAAGIETHRGNIVTMPGRVRVADTSGIPRPLRLCRSSPLTV